LTCPLISTLLMLAVFEFRILAQFQMEIKLLEVIF
jgi:hypothetical protein